MRNLSLILFLTLSSILLFGQGQSPHGDDLKYSCGDCHNTRGWSIDMDSIPFNHDTTSFTLTGQHAETNCQQCHTGLVFTEAESECFTCHQDVHETTVGFECQRCHDTESWLVDNITEIHQQSRFPLVGGHITADCYDCHDAASLLRFDPLGVECVDCHREEYLATTEPNHQEAGYATSCQDCHLITSFEWSAEGFNHSFFPLEKGHDIADCNACHEPGQPYEAIDAACFSCHEQDYNNSANPAHQELGFSTDCQQCHDLSRDWRPANFRSHDAEFFPIYSGEHQGEWDNCSQCHPNPANYAEFTCISCHEHNQGEMNDEHNDVNGYVYSSPACLACHPTGGEGEDFNHDKTGFPLQGEHQGADCTSCHADGYEGTSSYCADCHQQEFDEASNPSHTELDLSDDCALCHEPTPEWEPATFANHNEYYMIEGAHTEIANNCDECHGNDYINTPNTCYGCHEQDYTETNDPSHTAAQFSTDCETCHTQAEWEPATFDHDGQYFPIYSGEHQGEWDDCSECHPNPENYAEFTCIACHEHNQADMDEEHSDISGYVYNNQACLECHPDGSGEGAFDHNTTNFPLTGAHLSSSCEDCHADGYEGTSTYCADCHTDDFNSTTNPNHNELALSDDCATCHSTEPGWEPATFANHNDYYVLEGAHANIANQCDDCHSGDYINTPNTCFGCHETDYNQTTNPNHSSSGFATECTECHGQFNWSNISYPQHDGLYFPVYSGEHQGAWDNCSECHPNPNSYADFSCFACHPQGEMDSEHNDVSGYVYESTACLDCHPNGGDKMFMRMQRYDNKLK